MAQHSSSRRHPDATVFWSALVDAGRFHTWAHPSRTRAGVRGPPESPPCLGREAGKTKSNSCARSSTDEDRPLKFASSLSKRPATKSFLFRRTGAHSCSRSFAVAFRDTFFSCRETRQDKKWFEDSQWRATPPAPNWRKSPRWEVRALPRQEAKQPDGGCREEGHHSHEAEGVEEDR